MRLIRSKDWNGALAVVFASLLLAAGAAFAEPQEWNQKEASRLAAEFAQSIAKMSATAKAASPQRTAIQQRTRDGAVSRLHSVREAADALAEQLGEGRDRFATELFFAQVRELYRQTLAAARDAVAGAEQRSNIAAAENALDQLARYYDY
jgi:hypothetical protein